MRKKFFLAVSAAIVAAAAIGGVYVVNNSPVADELFDSNVEALTRRESTPAGTGPKKANLAFQIFCRCTNESPCSDDHGC